MSTRNTLLGGAALVAAFAVGRMFAPESAPPPPPPIVHAAPPAASTAQLRGVIRAELQREPITIVQHAAAPVDDEPSPEVLEQRATAFAQARGIVSSAIGAGRWTGADARALLAVLPQLSPEDYDEVMSSLIRPVNAQQVTVETRGALLDPT